ncbi:MAG: methyl-accepting chemotaxis protein [Pseudomonadota bacterium]
MSIKYRLAFIAGIPLLFLIFFAGQSIISSLGRLSDARSATEAVETAAVSSALIAELQRERGLSAAYMSAKGRDYVDRLEQQRLATDTALAEFDRGFDTKDDAATNAKAALAQLPTMRSNVDRLTTNLAESTRVYRSMVDGQLSLISGKMSKLTEKGFGEEPSAYIALLRSKEMSGLERSMGATGFTAGVFSRDVYRQYLEFRGAQIAILTPALSSMPPTLAKEAKSLLNGGRARDVQSFRQMADKGGAMPTGLGQKWFDASSARINSLSDVEASIGTLLKERANRMTRNALINLGVTLVIAIGCITGTAVFASRSALQFVGMLGKFSSSLQRIGKRDYNFKVAGEERRDELGDMARSLLTVREQLKEGEAANVEATYKGSGFNGSSVAMMITDRDLNIVYVNQAAKTFFKDHNEDFCKEFSLFDPETLVGACVDAFHPNPGQLRQMMADPGRLPFKSEIVIGDLRISLNMSAVYDRDGAFVGNTLEWINVTTARLNEGILKAIDQTQAIIEFDLDGNVLNANANFLAATGYARSDVIGRHHRMFCHYELTESREYADMWLRLAEGEHFVSLVKRKTKSGDVLYLDANYNPILDGNGRPFKIVKIASDVTETELERQAAEERRVKRAKDLSVVVENLAGGLSRISDGDFSEKIDTEFAEEYKALRADFNAAVDKLAEADRHQKETKEAQDLVVSHLETVLDQLSKGDLSVRMREPFAEAYEGMRQNFNRAIETLMAAMGTVDATGEDIKNGATEVSRASDELSQRTERQAATLEETTAAITEITATVAHSAKGATEVNEIVVETKGEAQKSGEIVENAVDAMGRIEQSSTEIASIIAVIDDIAFQTNLLALNAGVEAAHAGDAGRGFALVAKEVRNLAQRCTNAAKEIKVLVSSSAGHVSDGVEQVNSTGVALKEIIERIEKISCLANDIATSSQEQSSALDEVTKAVNELDTVTQKNAAMVEETTAASHQMRDNAVRLAALMDGFTLDDGARQNEENEQAPRRRRRPDSAREMAPRRRGAAA